MKQSRETADIFNVPYLDMARSHLTCFGYPSNSPVAKGNELKMIKLLLVSSWLVAKCGLALDSALPAQFQSSS